MITIQDVLEARNRIYPHLRPTLLIHYPRLSELVGASIWVKHENHMPIGAFKMRGGLNLVAQLSPEQRARGLASASTGNHGQGIAYAGQKFGVPVTIAMPENANPSKVAAMQALGASVVFHGPDFDTARVWMQQQAAAQGKYWVSVTDPALVAGVGTYALEIIEELPDVDAIVVPVGGGSGASGCIVVAEALKPSLQVIGVQSAGAPAQYLSWKGEDFEDAPMTTFAEGVATRVPFPDSQEYLRKGLSDFVLVDDSAIRTAIVHYLEHAHTLVEGAGAAPLAAALQLRDRLAGKKVVLVATGGNISLTQLRETLGQSGAAG